MNYLSLLICKLIGKHAETRLRKGETMPEGYNVNGIGETVPDSQLRICRRCGRVRLATARKGKA